MATLTTDVPDLTASVAKTFGFRVVLKLGSIEFVSSTLGSLEEAMAVVERADRAVRGVILRPNRIERFDGFNWVMV